MAMLLDELERQAERLVRAEQARAAFFERATRGAVMLHGLCGDGPTGEFVALGHLSRYQALREVVRGLWFDGEAPCDFMAASERPGWARLSYANGAEFGDEGWVLESATAASDDAFPVTYIDVEDR